MPRKINIDRIRDEFLDKTERATQFITNVRSSSHPGKSKAPRALHAKHVGLAYERSFLKVIASWEELLEHTLIRYMVGAKTLSGYQPVLRIGKVDSVRNAYRLLSRDINFTIGKHYLSLSSPRWVAKAAGLFFKDHPYDELLEKPDLIKHANSIRNHIAHSSQKSKEDFTKAATYFVRFNHGSSDKSRSGYTPGELLQEKAKRHFSIDERNEGETIYGSYCQHFRNLANKIVPP